MPTETHHCTAKSYTLFSYLEFDLAVTAAEEEVVWLLDLGLKKWQVLDTQPAPASLHTRHADSSGHRQATQPEAKAEASWWLHILPNKQECVFF